MDLQSLKRQLALPEIHARILSGYEGGYTLGIGLDKHKSRVVILQLEDASARCAFSFPTKVDFGEESVRVLVRELHGAPKAMAAD